MTYKNFPPLYRYAARPLQWLQCLFLLEAVSFIPRLSLVLLLAFFIFFFMALVPLFHLMSLMTRVFAVFHWHAWVWCSRLCLICSVGESVLLCVTETIHLTFVFIILSCRICKINLCPEWYLKNVKQTPRPVMQTKIQTITAWLLSHPRSHAVLPTWSEHHSLR